MILVESALSLKTIVLFTLFHGVCLFGDTASYHARLLPMLSEFYIIQVNEG